MSGPFNFVSIFPVHFVALCELVNERAEILVTALPCVPVTASTKGTVYFPRFAARGGGPTEEIPVKPADVSVRGTVRFPGTPGETAAGPRGLKLTDGRTGSMFPNPIPVRSATRPRRTCLDR